MPLFFFDTYDGFVSIDDDGIDLPDMSAVQKQVRATLPSMLAHEAKESDKAQFRIDVRDVTGERVLTGTVLMVIDCFDDPTRPGPHSSSAHVSSLPSALKR